MTRTRWVKAQITVVSGLSAVALISAVTSPATGYELDIYAATPVVTWGALGLVAVIGIAAAVWGSGSTRVLGGAAIAGVSLVVISLPLLRSYYFLGISDSLTYLGLSRHILQSGTVQEMIYPALPILAAVLTEITGMSLEQSWLVILAFTACLFVAGNVIAVRTINNRSFVVTLGLLFAALFLPINQITRAGVFTPPSTTTIAIFLVPVLLFFVIRLWNDGRPAMLGGMGIWLFALLFVHPQQAANSILVTLVIGAIALLWPAFESREIVRWKRYVSLSIAAILGFWLWVSHTETFSNAIRVMGVRLMQASTTGDVSDVGGSLSAVGGSLPELFVKLFLVSAVAGTVVGVATAVAIAPDRFVSSRLRPIGEMESRELAVALSIVPVGGLAIVYVFVLSQYFRHIGFIMALVTVLSPLAIARSLRGEVPFERAGKVVVAALFAGALLLTVLSLQFSPWVFQDSHHVTEAEVTGYEHTFETINEGEDVGYLRLAPYRYYDAIYGTPVSHARAFFPHSSHDLYELEERVATASADRYYVVTESDRRQEFGLYNEAFLQREEVMYLQHRSDRVYFNGEVELYRQEVAENG